MAKIYVDSNAFITAFEREGRLSDSLVCLFVHTPVGDGPLLVKPLAQDALISLYEGWTQSSACIDVVPVTRDILFDAAGIRARNGSQKLPDATHIATARFAQCTHLVSNDLRMRPDFNIEMVRLKESEINSLIATLENDH